MNELHYAVVDTVPIVRFGKKPFGEKCRVHSTHQALKAATKKRLPGTVVVTIPKILKRGALLDAAYVAARPKNPSEL